MIIHNPILTGSFTVNGTDVASITSSAASIASLNSYTASLNAKSSSFATTGSNTFVGNQVVSGSLTVTGSITTPGTLTAQTLVVQTITSSVDFVTGSTRFGSLSSNTHQFTGSMSVSGSGTFVGNVIAGDIIRVSGSGAYLSIYDTQASSKNWAIRAGHDAVGDLAIRQSNSTGGDPVAAGTTRLYINASGNVGIGVIPSAWYTGYTALQVGESAALFSNRTSADTRTTQLANNAYLNSGATNWIYAQTDEATRYEQVNGEHKFYTAASGTAGNNITWTTPLSIASTGAATFSNTTSGLALKLFTSYASGRALNFGFSDGSVLPTAAFYIGNQTGVGVFIGDETTTNGLYVKSGGNVGIGTTSPATLDSGGVNLQIKDRSSLFQLGVVNSTYLGNNVYYDGSWKRIVSGFGTLIRLTDDNNGFSFLTTGTGAPNSAVTFTNAMTITSGGNVQINGPVYRYNGQTVVGGSFTNLTSIDLSSSRTYLISMIATNVEANLGYRIFGVIQANATSSTYSFSDIASQTMAIQFSGTTVQARVTNGQQWTFNWSILQLL